nr:DNA adenine methylase [Candidatus Sigynarchaeota archaeon]
ILSFFPSFDYSHNFFVEAEKPFLLFDLWQDKDDFVYLDPPYVPLSVSASFTSYSKENFGIADQQKLFSVFKELDRRGCKVMLSNSYCEFILDLYAGFRIETPMAIRAINSVGSKRGKIKEVLILNEFT